MAIATELPPVLARLAELLEQAGSDDQHDDEHDDEGEED